jgi:hypothetical protein
MDVLSPETSQIAAAIPEYVVERELGRGGMGVVYLGRHQRLGRAVAIKELPPSFAVEPEVRARFSTEAQTLAGLSHPHIVPIFDYVEREGLCLIVMEQLPGGTVWDRFTTTGLTPPMTCGVVMACCAALQYAHDKGVLHLDVKPDNLMFDAESAVKVTDFGIARVISGDRTMGTVDGQVLGTPAYMSPEQARGEDLTPASDVYATGVMLYELLSGQLPWLGAQTAGELLAQRLDVPPVPLRDAAPHLPPPLAEVVMRALAVDLEDRHQRAEDLGVEIGEACVASWGEDWLDHAGVAVFGSGRMARAARTTGSHLPAAPAPPKAAPVPVSGAPSAGGVTVARGPADRSGAPGTVITGKAGAAPAGAGATGAGTAVPAARETGLADAPPPARETVDRAAPAVPPPPAPPTVDPAVPADPGSSASEFGVVRAAGAEPRILGADLNDLELADLIGVEDVLDPPQPPWRALAVTGALGLALLLLALIGIGVPDREAGLERDVLQLDGQDVASGERIDLDLSEPLEVRVTDPRLARRADEVELAVGYLGADLASASAPLRDGAATLDPGIAQRAVGGPATATVSLLAGERLLGVHELPIRATQTWYLTAPAVGGLLLLLLGLANLESSLKPLRSGRRRRLSYVGASVAGAVIGLSLVPLAGAVGAGEPTVPTVVAAGVLGAATGVAAVGARIGVARRRRVQRALRRAERSLGVTSGT